MKILQHLTELVQIYRGHTFPFDQLRYQKNITTLQNLFQFEIVNFGQSGYIEQPLLIEMRNGLFENHNIRRLSIEQRKVVLYINSESSIAEKASQSFVEFLNTLNTNVSQSIEVETIKTEIFSKLDIDFKNLFSSKISKLIKVITSSDENIAQTNPFGIKYKIQYKTPDHLTLDGIILSEKEFIFEKKAGTNEDEKLFYSCLPLSTKKHTEFLKLLQELNQ